MSTIDTVISALNSGFSGSLIRPGDAPYDATRAVMPGGIDKHPADARAYLDKHHYSFPAAIDTPALRRVLGKRRVIPQIFVVSADGRLVEFSEWETSERTEITGGIASRFGEYRKSGILDGVPFEGGGTKTIQFVRPPDGWRIAAFAWHDEA